MNYTNSITRKGQITIPKEFRDKLGLDKLGKVNLKMNESGEIVITIVKNLSDVRVLLNNPSFKDPVSEKEQDVGSALAKKYRV